LTLFLRVLVNNILPAFLIMGIGFALDRTLKPDLQSISRLALYALSPCLIFSSLVTSELQGGQMSAIVLHAATTILLMAVIALLTARLLRLDQATTSAFTLSTSQVNSGNLGLSVILFAYGEKGLQQALIYFVTSAVLANTFHAFIASRSHGSWRDALRNVARLPLIYAATLAVAIRLAGYCPPDIVMRPVSTVGQAAVPVMLILLGMQLSRTQLDNDRGLIVVASTYKLVLMTLVAVAVASIYGLTGLTRKVGIVESSTPTAVTASVLSLEFQARPEIVASTILVSTLASALTLTVIIALLG